MCGVFGLYSTKNTIDETRLADATLTLTHRGPDEFGLWVSPDKSVGMGHTRLSIIDPKTGKQPLRSSDNSIVAVVNGEFYDYKKIREDLIKHGHRFLTNSDSEILIALYREYNLNLFQYLNGEFSFILWDDKKKRIIAGRDRFGAKPLYYAFHDATLYIASEIKAIFKAGFKPEWNDIAVANFCYGIPSQDLSCFSGINLVKPGHFILKDHFKLTQIPYWDLNFDKTLTCKKEDYIENFRTLFENSVNKRLIGDVEIGCYLSGGIDSSSILAIASKTHKNIKAFNISFEDNRDYDERQYAEIMSKHLGVELLTLNINEEKIASEYSNAIYFRESLVYQTSGVAKLLLSAFTKKNHIKSVLTGEGADEILYGYPSFKEDLIFSNESEKVSSALLEKLINENKKCSSAYVSAKNYHGLDSYIEKIGYAPSFLKLSHEISHFCHSIFTDDFKNSQHIKNNPFNDFLSKFETDVSKIKNQVNKSIYLWSKSFFPELILSFLGDRMEMANSIEGRLPFLDRDLVEFSLSLPIEYKIHNDLTEKFILRESVKDILPKEIYTRKKHIYAAPPISNNITHKSHMFALMQDSFASSEFKNSPFFDQEKTIHLLNNLGKLNPRDCMIAEFALNTALSSYFLNKHFIQKTGSGI